MKRLINIALPVLVLYLLGVQSVAATSNVPKRDHLTPQEADLVREAQLLDQRIAVFIHAVERRVVLVTGEASSPGKKKQKEAEKWGEPPMGTRAELLGDIARILDEAITNIDDVAAREDANQKVLQKALRALSQAANQFVVELQSLRDKTKGSDERDVLEQALESAQEVIEAAGKLPQETKAKNKS
jgi:hypothetical protein